MSKMSGIYMYAIDGKPIPESMLPLTKEEQDLYDEVKEKSKLARKNGEHMTFAIYDSDL